MYKNTSKDANRKTVIDLFQKLFCCLQESEQDMGRSDQMAALRSLCLPRLTFLLLSVLQSSSRHQEALRLADIISSDQHRLYQVIGSHSEAKYKYVKWWLFAFRRLPFCCSGR